jgi:type IX secretion system PorP/SprF family membrane protein
MAYSFKLFRILLVMVFLITCGQAYSQKEAMYSQYMYSMMTINPAYAGVNGKPTLSSIFRNQWVGIEGAPSTTLLTYDMPFSKDRLGAGLKIIDDRLGIEHTTTYSLGMSTHFKLSPYSRLSFGLDFGRKMYEASLSLANTYTPGDASFSQNVRGGVSQLGTGIFYDNRRLSIGLSSPNILKSDITISQIDFGKSSSFTAIHLFTYVGYSFDINENVKFKPSIMAKSVSGSSLQLDLNSNVWLKDLIGIGASYRTGDAIVGMLQCKLKKSFQVGYSYDSPINTLGANNGGSHEIFMLIHFKAIEKK